MQSFAKMAKAVLFRVLLNCIVCFTFLTRAQPQTLAILRYRYDQQAVGYFLFLLVAKVVFRGDEVSAKLSLGIDEAVMLASDNAIKGVHQFILIVSADGTSRYVFKFLLFIF